MRESFVQIVTRLSLSNNELKEALNIAAKDLEEKQNKLEEIKYKLARMIVSTEGYSKQTGDLISELLEIIEE